MPRPPCTAFLSYARDDDGDKSISRLRVTLENEVRQRTGWDEFRIFQDTDEIKWGEQWDQIINESLGVVLFLVFIITPRSFNSHGCAAEIEKFLERERELERTDLILPIYLLEVEEIEDEQTRHSHKIAHTLTKHQFVDWKEVDLGDFDNPAVRKRVKELGRDLAKRLKQLRKELKAAEPTEQVAGRGHGPPPNDFQPAIPESADLTVDPAPHAAHPRSFRTLAQAVAEAAPGQIISVKPGIHHGPVMIDKVISIVGDGAPGEVILESDAGPVVALQADGASLVNLTLRQTGIGPSVLRIVRGSATIEECDISGKGMVCVSVEGDANPVLRFNKLHDGKCGISYKEGAGGTAEGNEIYSQAGNGIETAKAAKPRLRRNVIRSTGDHGVYAGPGSHPVLEFNEIRETATAAIRIDGANPVVRRNTVHHAGTLGIEVVRGATGRIVANDIHHNGGAGIEVADESDPIVLRNRIHDGDGAGVVIRNGGKGEFKSNDICGNGRANVEIRDKGAPHLCFNVISEGKEYGVFIHTSGRGTIERNEIHRNKFAGVEIMTGADPLVRGNAIHSGPWGVLVRERGKGTIDDNEIFRNEMAGVCSREERSKPIVRNNRIHHNKLGIKREMDGGGEFEENQMWRNPGGDWDPPQ